MQINGGAYFDIEVGEHKEFLSYDDVLYFEMTEYSGCAGQVFALQFRTTSAEIKNLFIENNPITIRLGNSKSNAETFKLIITEHKENQDASNNLWIINIAAIQDPSIYLERSSFADVGTSLTVLKNIADERFNGFETDIKQVAEDTGNLWLSHYQTVAEYIKEVWLHMYIGDAESCPVIYIDKKNKLHLKDVNLIKKQTPSFKFIPNKGKSGSNNIQYLNNFKPKSYKFLTNIYTGYGCVVDITSVDDGKTKVCIPDNKPDISSTKKVEKSKVGARFITNKLVTGNTHKYYQYAYYTNVARLVRLSSIVGDLIVTGYQPKINILDLVEVDDGTKVHSGYYLVNTKVTYFSYNTPVMTRIAVCRDNKNRVEDSSIDKTQVFKIANKTVANMTQWIRNARRLVALGKKAMNGTLVSEILAYLKQFKYNLLSSIVFAGVRLNLNSKTELMASMTAIGNSLVNKIIFTYIPYPYNYVLKDIAVNNYSMKTLLSRLLAEFAPYEIKSLMVELTGLLVDLTSTSNTVTQENKQAIANTTYSEGGYGTESKQEGTDMSTQTNTQRVQTITDEFVDNTEGADLPIPMIDLDESESLLNDADLRDLVADKVMASLEEQGYLKGMTPEERTILKKAMKGDKDENGEQIHLNLDIINKIKSNTGEMLYCRYWGAFQDPSEITDYFVTNSFKDIYLTVPTTKIINALKGARVFIAYPKTEEDLVFYINNKEVDMEVIEDFDLGLFNLVGNPLLYNIYMSEETFNSNNVILEVRKK